MTQVDFTPSRWTAWGVPLLIICIIVAFSLPVIVNLATKLSVDDAERQRLSVEIPVKEVPTLLVDYRGNVIQATVLLKTQDAARFASGTTWRALSPGEDYAELDYPTCGGR